MKKFPAFLFLPFLSFTAPCAAQDADSPQWAVVHSSSCFLRSRADYASPVESQALMGTVLRVREADRYWLKVDAPDYEDVWTTQGNLTMLDEAGRDAWIAAPKYVCTTEYTHLYETPSETAERVCDLTLFGLVGKGGGRRRDWVEVRLPSGRSCWARERDLTDYDEWVRSRESGPDRLVAAARRFLGTPYMWGGASAAYFDCSGFIQFVFRQCGIILPRNAGQQACLGEEVPYAPENLRPGDLLFFGTPATGGKPMRVSHVAMYCGAGKIIHASMVVRISSLVPGGEDFYDRTPVTVRRLPGRPAGGPYPRLVSARAWYY